MINLKTKKRMCHDKVSFHTKRGAMAVAKKFNQRVYECPICFLWHTTSSENWESEYVTAKHMNKVITGIENSYKSQIEQMQNQHKFNIRVLKEEIKKLKTKGE